MKRTLTLEYWVEDGWYAGRFQEVLGVFSQGETLPELEANLKAACQMLMEESATASPARVQTKQVEWTFHPKAARGSQAPSGLASRRFDRRQPGG